MITLVGQSTPQLDMVSSFGIAGPYAPGNVSTAASITAAAATHYYALDIPAVHVVKRFWWANGADVSGARTVIVALYRDAGFKPGARLATTSATVQTPANNVQFAAPSGGDFTISPGTYWIAIATSSATNATLFGNTISGSLSAIGAYQEAIVTPPATATPAEKTNTSYFLCGFSTTTLV